MNRSRQHSNEQDYEIVTVRNSESGRPIKSSLKQHGSNQQNEPVTCGCVEIVDSEYFSGCKQIKLKDSQRNNNKMERSRRKVRSPRMKVSNVQYAPEGRRWNSYVDEEGRKIYRTSGKSGNSKRYVVMDNGDLERGERTQQSNVIYKDTREETEYETVSEADSEYLVPVRPKGRAVEERPRVLTKRIISENERPLTATYQTLDGNTAGGSYVLRTRPRSDYAVIREGNSTGEYLVRSSRPASAQILTKRIATDDSRGRYVVRGRPSSAKHYIEKKEVAYIARPKSEERPVTYVARPRSQEVAYVTRPRSDEVTYVKRARSTEREAKYVTKNVSDDETYVKRPISDKKEITYITRPRSEDRTLQRQEYIEYPQDYVIQRPPTRDVGCQMTTNYVIQQPPKPRKLLRNVQTQTPKKEKQRKIKTATRYYQRETVEVVEEPKVQTPRTPTPPRIRTPTPPRIPSPPPPRVPTPEPPRQPKPPKKKKHRKDKEMQLVVKQPSYPEPVYDTVEDLEVVPAPTKIYYDEPKKSPPSKKPDPEPPRYAYYEPSEYTTSKSLVPAPPEKDITAESTSNSSSSNGESAAMPAKFYTVPLKGPTTFYGPYYRKDGKFPSKRKSKHKKKHRHKPKSMYEHKSKPVYEQPRYVEMPSREQRKQKPFAESSYETNGDSVPPSMVETYLKKIHNPPFHVKNNASPRSSLKRPDDKQRREPRGPVQIEDYAAKLPHGPSFYLEHGQPVDPSAKNGYHPTVMYVNPKTEKVEPLKYSMDSKPAAKNKNKKYIEPEEETRYVVVPGFEDHSSSSNIQDIVDNSEQQPSSEPLVVIEDSRYPYTKSLSLRNQSDMEDTYLTPLSHDLISEKPAKGKAHMVRVGGGWMKVEHHRNHHTPLKIYEIPRDANDDKFLYIKSRFNTNKKEVPIAYKKYREEIIRG